MKIRADFVANSSSSSSVCIRVKSEQLAQLLARYRRLFEKGVRIFSDGVFVEEEYADAWADVPQALDQLLYALLAGLKSEVILKFIDSPQVGEAEQEIKNRRQELTDSVQQAVWDFWKEFVDEDEEPIGRKRFFYDREKGGNGNYLEEPYNEEGEYTDCTRENFFFDEEFEEDEDNERF